MSVFAQELKKVWRPGIIIALLASGIVFWFLVGRGPGIAAFPNGSQAAFEFELAKGWVERFGPSIDNDEMAAVRNEARAAEDSFESDLVMLDGAAKRGLYTRAEFDVLSREVFERECAVQQAGSELDEGLKADITFCEQVLELPSYERAYEMDLWLQALEGEEGARGFLSHMWLQDIETYLIRLSMWLVIAPVFVMAPAAARDRLYRVRALQWTSRAGRKVFFVQLAVAVLSATLVLIMSILAWAIPFAGTGIETLLGCVIVGPFSGYIGCWDMALGTYLGIRIVLSASLGFAAGLLSFALGRRSTGYVGMLLRVVPLCAGIGWLLAPALFDHALCDRTALAGTNPFSTGWLPVGGETLIVAAIVIAAIANCVFAFTNERRCDLR